jgi:drug/metabolite transporter (DMT)-like permease
METWHVAAALLSALLHAGWNAAVKAHDRPDEAMVAQMVVSAILMCPVLVWLGRPSEASWPWILASTLMNAVTVHAMLKAYALLGFGFVYPIARALSVLLVVPLASYAMGESVSTLGVAGVVLMACALLLLGAGPGVPGDNSRPNARGAGFAWTVLAGVSTALYVMADAQGVRAAGNALSYGSLVAMSNAVVFALVRPPRRPLVLIPRKTWLGAVPIGVSASLSYWLILWVWSVAPIAPSAALRDTSAIFALLIALVWLREPLGRLQIGAITIAALAIPLLRLS